MNIEEIVADGTAYFLVLSVAEQTQDLLRCSCARPETTMAQDLTTELDEAVRLADALAEQGRWEEAYRAQLVCDELRAALYRQEVDRTIKITEERTKLDREREAVRERDRERDRILHAVLPPHIAEQLKQGRTRIAERLPSVTILFVDIAGFTEKASGQSPTDLVRWLEAYFTSLDDIFIPRGCERIKTIGDSYMTICGTRAEDTDHVQRMIGAAIDVLHGTAPLPVDRSQLRIGLHTGPVIAGVMSGAKLSYDVWGDTVNVAARMEAHSQPGRIHCSAEVARVLATDPTYRLIQREPLDIRGKGLMTTYFVERTS